jgi:hypothetical protein
MNFPANPTLNQTYTYGSKTWKWDGTAWNLQAAGVAQATVAFTGSFSDLINKPTTLSGYGITDGFTLPTQTGNTGKFLTTNGTVASWGTVDALPTQTGNTGKFLTTNGTVASWATVSVTPTAVSDQANTSTGYFYLPKGTTAQRPASPVTGMLRYNTTTGTLEQYNITGWESIGGNQPVITGITQQIYNSFAGATITIAGNYFGLNAVTVRFSFGGTVSDVSVTPSVTTSITVSIPSAIYSLAIGTAGNVSVIDSTGKQSNGFGKTILGLPGSSSSYPAASPYAIRSFYGSTPTAGVYWFSNSGYNSGNPFQAYADWSTDSTYGMMVLCGLLISDNSRTSYTQFGTAATAAAGTPGFRNTHNLASNSILSGWSGDTRNRCYLGMTSQTGGINIGSSTTQWLLLNTSLSVFKNMFDNAPGNGEFDLATGIVNTSTGASGRLYYSTSHGSNLYQMTNAGNTVNANLWFEFADPSSVDYNHSACVWAAGNGQYYGLNAPFTARWMFMAISPDNI